MTERTRRVIRQVEDLPVKAEAPSEGTDGAAPGAEERGGAQLVRPTTGGES